MRRLDNITDSTDSMDMNLSKLQEIVKTEEPGVLQSTGPQRFRRDLATEQQFHWGDSSVMGPNYYLSLP